MRSIIVFKFVQYNYLFTLCVDVYIKQLIWVKTYNGCSSLEKNNFVWRNIKRMNDFRSRSTSMSYQTALMKKHNLQLDVSPVLYICTNLAVQRVTSTMQCSI